VERRISVREVATIADIPLASKFTTAIGTGAFSTALDGIGKIKIAIRSSIKNLDILI
jgi:hypothetical protein